MTNKAVTAANGPAVTLIYRGAMGISALVLLWLATTFMGDREATHVYRNQQLKKEGELAVALERLNVTLLSMEEKYAERMDRLENDIRTLREEQKESNLRIEQKFLLLANPNTPSVH